MLISYIKYRKSHSHSNNRKWMFFKLSYTSSRCGIKKNSYAVYSVCGARTHPYSFSIELPRKLYG